MIMIMKILEKIKNIFLGNLWSIFHINETPEWEKRMAICNACENKIQYTKNVSVCKLCGCIITSKCKIKNETCDLNKW